MGCKINHKALHFIYQNKWSAFSLFYILIWAFLALFAYVIAPDNTQNANWGDLNIASQRPGFQVKMLEIPYPHRFSLKEYFFGTEHIPEKYPIRSFSIQQDSLLVELFHLNPKIVVEKKFPLNLWEKSSNKIVSTSIYNQTFWLGTDKAGRDYLSRILVGARISLSIGLVAVFISLVLGIFLGALAGYYGGWADQLILWLIQVVWSIPTLLMVIAITLSLGKGFWQVFIAVGLTMWVEVARVVRGQILSVKKMPYITAAKALGFKDARILIYHILPNIIGPIVVIAAANFASAILVESGLSFLGLGAQPPTPSWGSMIKDYYGDMILGRPYLALIPGMAIMTIVLAFMMVGNGIRDYFDVK